MRVTVSREKCIASGMCVLTCSQLFAQSENDGSVEVLTNHPAIMLIDRVKEVVSNCPAQVFRIEDAENTSELLIESED
jgi:ferredoxin